MSKFEEDNLCEIITPEDEDFYIDEEGIGHATITEEELEQLMKDANKERAKKFSKIEKLEKNPDGLPYDVIYYEKPNDDEKPLERVVGHENQKKELLSVIDWFKNSKTLKEKGISIPKGVILFGDPGNGKSLLMKEIVKCAGAPAFIYRGDEDNVVKGIVDTFAKAREVGHAIIVIDELDLLINKERRVVRALQENLDGVESSDDILVLTATNDIDEIPHALLRSGRLEKIIRVPYPTGQEAVTLLKKYFKEFNVSLPSDFDEEEAGLSLNRVSCAAIKSIVNDCLLRNGFENITTEMIDNSIFGTMNRVKDRSYEDNIEVAVHEAGHALMAFNYPEFFTINKLHISGASGEFHCKQVEHGFWPYEKVIADIKISMAGVIAQKVIFGRGTRGCEEDLENARIDAYNMFNKCGYSSCWETLPEVRSNVRTETAYKRRKMEAKIEKLLKRCEKETYKYVKKNKDKIQALGDKLFEKKHLKSSEILSIIG